jgi:hypothetical protein
VTATLVHLVPVGATFRHDGVRYTLLRHHRGGGKGKHVIAWRREGGGVGMTVLADTDRLDVVA